MEAGSIPWELRAMAENTKQCSEGPSFAKRMWSARKNVGTDHGSDGRAVTDKLGVLSRHREGFRNGNNESHSPKYFILHLKQKGNCTGCKRQGPLPESQATHPLTPRLGPWVTCPKAVVSQPCVPGPCSEVPLRQPGLYTLQGSPDPGKRAACYPGTISRVTEVSKFLKLSSQINASRKKMLHRKHRNKGLYHSMSHPTFFFSFKSHVIFKD